jgi:hypothetical protein
MVSTGNEAGQRRRRRVQLTPVRSVPVEFSRGRASEGPLTLGQLDVYTWLSAAPDHPYATLYAELPVPAVAPAVSDVAQAVAALIGRHESLRTTWVPGERPRQRVAASGVLMLEACSLGEGQWGPGDRPAVAGALIRWLREPPDPARRPVRIAVAIAPGPGDQVIACAVALTHLAADHGAIEILKRDFAALLAGRARRQPGPPGHQPLDQAELEATPAERARGQAALDHLRDQFRRMPRCLYALPGTQPSGESLAVELSSPAAAMATARIAARTRTSRSAIVLAATCATVAHRANYPELTLHLVSSNRFQPHLLNYVGALSQGAMATITIGERSFDELVRHTWTTVMEANRLARYDVAKRDAMNDLIEHERGLRLTLDPLFNNIVPQAWSGLTAGIEVQPGESDIALARTELKWRPMPASRAPIRFSLNQVDGCLRLDAWSGDTGLLPRAELESVLLAIERLLATAAHADVPAGQLPALTGLQPIPGTPDRILIDHCWVDVAEVQRLVDAAVAPAIARVFASAGGRPLVAQLAATDAIHTPEQAHNRCMAILADHPTAITPRHYVICPTAPSDPADPTAWPPPLATGTGRT